tara:strand:+ start:101 stop:715 length:615 start_codon:yes stop_codon:yes gene_type:complete
VIQLEITILIAVLTAIIGPLLVTKYRHYLKQKENVDPIAYTIKLNREIDNELEILREELGCCRIWLSQFHNGGNFYPTGKSIQKFSTFYEHTGMGVVTIKEIFQNIPVSLFSKPFSELYENNMLIIEDYKIGPTFGLGSIGNQLNNKSSYIFALKNLNGHFLGTLGIDFCKRKKVLDEETLIELENKSAAIGALLNSYLLQTNK